MTNYILTLAEMEARGFDCISDHAFEKDSHCLIVQEDCVLLEYCPMPELSDRTAILPLRLRNIADLDNLLWMLGLTND